ncbi:MAG: type I methionyl aminopeptidase [Bacteroidales bacterium]|jgi:methionyl aminopeptidase|nr:type I methionyl aminopeptidase [Bacteroidales bacterium]
MLEKTDHEIELLRASALLVSKTLAEVGRMVCPGVTTYDLDKRAEEYIRDNGAKPGFKGYHGFPNTLCTSVNGQVVHGIPSRNTILKDGDIVSVDCGVIWNRYYGDSAYTFSVGEVSESTQRLLQITKEALFKGIEAATTKNRIGDVSWAVQQHAESNGFSVVRELVGHGIGTDMHEKPEVPNYGRRGSGPRLRKNMVICIEPMINKGKKDVVEEKDGWTIRTKDQQPSAHFELTVAIGEQKADILSTFAFIDEKLKLNLAS